MTTTTESAVRVDPVRVAPHERDVIAVARALFGQGTYLAIEPTLAARTPIEKLGPSAMAVLKSTLAKGTVKTLARLGGAQPRLRPGTKASAKPMRAFDVRATPAMEFGPYSYELLRWLASVPLDDVSAPELHTLPRTIGDELLAYLAVRLVEGQRLERRVASQAGARASALVWLGHARALGRHESDKDPEKEPPSFEKLLTHADGCLVIECLANDLARRWIDAAHWSGDNLLDAARALRIATAERRTLDSFLDTLERHGRWDLGTFLVDAGARLLIRGSRIDDVAARAAPPIRAEGPLRPRTEARRRAGAVYHALVRLGARREHLSLVRFFEDGYDDAQSLLTTWDVLGRDGFARASEVIRALDSLDGTIAADDDKEI